MAHATKTPEAQLDLDRVVAFIAQDNLSAALRWLSEIEQLFDLLAEQPEVGQEITSRRFGKIRRHVKGSYLIYYRAIANGVQILMVAHGARDQNRLL
jgi:toxin ParE1/3/4